MKTLNEFIAERLHEHNEFDGEYPNQCVDLVQYYNEDVVGAPPFHGNAKDYVNNPLPAYYNFHSNPLWYVPPSGAIAVWNGNVGGGFGHVGVVTEASLLRFKSFDQNWPEGNVAEIIEHNYTNVVGFLIPKPVNNISMYNGLLTDLENLLKRYPRA